jgi:hypothetical protein
MKIEVAVQCGKVRQVFEIEFEPEDIREPFDTEAAAEVFVCAVVATEGIVGLRKIGFHFKRIRYESPYPGGYQGPERIGP